MVAEQAVMIKDAKYSPEIVKLVSDVTGAHG